MKKLSYTKLKEKVKKANKKEYYALLAVLWWIPLGSVWCAIAIWLRSSNQIKSFLGLNKNLMNKIISRTLSSDLFFCLLFLIHTHK